MTICYASGISITESGVLHQYSRILTFMDLSSALPITKQLLRQSLGVHGRKDCWLVVVAAETNASSFGTVKVGNCLTLYKLILKCVLFSGILMRRKSYLRTVS